MSKTWHDPKTGCVVTDCGTLWQVEDGTEIFILPKPAKPGESRIKRAIANYQAQAVEEK